MNYLSSVRTSIAQFLGLLCLLILPITSNATLQYYTNYVPVTTLPGTNGNTATEGFAVGSTYTYSVKVGNSDTSASLYKTTMSSAYNQIMTSVDDPAHPTTSVGYLGHANDVALTTSGSNNWLFVATMKTGTGCPQPCNLNLVKLSYTGYNYHKLGSFAIQSGGVDLRVTGVKILSQDTSNINFLFLEGPAHKFYKGSIALTANSGTIAVTPVFAVDVASALVNGHTVSGLSTWTTQGVELDRVNDTLYFPLTNGGSSIVLVYRNISSAANSSTYTTITSDPDLSFRIDTALSKFEIEGVGIGIQGRLYFNTNQSDTDGVYYFDTYVAPNH